MKEEISWPPRPPGVLMSTSASRERMRLQGERTSPSPTPTRFGISTGNFKSLPDTKSNDLDIEDEETLQLQLQEIQARLKLKKLQNKKRQLENKAESCTDESVAELNSDKNVADFYKFSRAKALGSKQKAVVDVPVSPIRKTLPPETQRSPGRVLLGIDKGLRGCDVSLRRVQGYKDKYDQKRGRPNSFNRRCDSQGLTQNLELSTQTQAVLEKPKSFNEKLAAVRRQDTDDQLRQLNNQRSRSTAFDIDQEQIQDFKRSAVDFASNAHQSPDFSRDEVISSITTRKESLLQTKKFSNIHSTFEAKNIFNEIPKIDSKKNTNDTSNTLSGISSEHEASKFEPYSSQHLARRIIPHQNLTRSLAGKKTYLIHDLLRDVKAPDFAAPDIEQDFVLLAIIASKSEPKAHRTDQNKRKRGKFMALTLTDLKWELDFFLFDSAFEKFWKMTPGTIIAILNPLMMPPPRDKINTGKFSIMLNSDADTILEIGLARDLGFCKSIKRDGKICSSWVDKRHSEFCDYHVNNALSKTHSSRMEVNTMTFGKGKYNFQKTRNKSFESLISNGYKKTKSNDMTRYDRETHSQIYIGQKSTTSLLDDVDFDPDRFHRGTTKEERMTRRLLSKERERNLEKKLAALGNGLGAEYARARQSDKSPTRSANCVNSIGKPSNSNSLGLLDKSIDNVSLSPLKRKRKNTFSSTTPKRRGNSLAEDLGNIKSNEIPDAPSATKKTRFVTEKGIREAGRESLDISSVIPDESDDELEIIRN
ncbi:putative primase zinc finger [Golovinomyces cichoracearum]|uniref:Putative primase zinc finger n=1 Tax=Golovinomyces cichoracearum TaxID=62708 RepID=A0A420J6E9_9PEZI|nr:putative primase zinc finger [Golovinomyces cichoracearum]